MNLDVTRRKQRKWKGRQSLGVEPRTPLAWAATARRPPTFTILYMFCTGGTECHSRTPDSHSVCAVRTPLGVDRKILSIRKEYMLSGFFTLNAQRTLRLKPEVSWVRLLAATGLFAFLYLRLITSKFIYFQHEARCSEQVYFALY